MFIALLLAAAAFIPEAAAQAELMTKKKDIGDVSSKITKIYLTGDTFTNLMLKEEIEKSWSVSPYEFCNGEEFERCKTDTNYFFLTRILGQNRKEAEPSIEYLALLRGGPEAENGIDKMVEVISIPFKSVDDEDGRYPVFIPAFINIIQEHIPRVTRSDLAAYTAIYSYTRRIDDAADMQIIFSDTDLSPEVDAELRQRYFDADMTVTGADEADEAFEQMLPGTLVSYTITPEGVKGAYSYKMLISTEDYGLYYFRKHKVGRKTPAGFRKDDIRRITVCRERGNE